VVPYGYGGVTDFRARILAAPDGNLLNQERTCLRFPKEPLGSLTVFGSVSPDLGRQGRYLQFQVSPTVKALKVPSVKMGHLDLGRVRIRSGRRHRDMHKHRYACVSSGPVGDTQLR